MSLNIPVISSTAGLSGDGGFYGRVISSGIVFAEGDKLVIFHSTGNMTDVEIEPIWA